MTPVRLRLSRAKGFNLQALSVATNGLPAVNVSRPSQWGNPYAVEPVDRMGRWAPGSRESEYAKRRHQVVEMFRGMLAKGEGEPWSRMSDGLSVLRGKNLACWCPLPKEGESDVCHAAVLLEVANAVETRAPAGEGTGTNGRT